MIRFLMIWALPLILVSCAQDGGVLDVNSFHLRNTEDLDDNYGMIRAEQMRVLHGAVTREERQDRLGQYYKVRWDTRSVPNVKIGRTEVVFKYHQAATASKVLEQRVAYGAGGEKGIADFEIRGENYFNGGRVLSWKIELQRDGRVLDSRQSYMWE